MKKIVIEERRKVVKVGGSYVVALPKNIRRLLNLKVGDIVRLSCDEEVLMINKERKNVYVRLM